MASTILLFVCSLIGFTKASYPFRNVSLPWDDRVDDLVNRLTIEEMTSQMTGAVETPDIHRLGIDPYSFATECLRGDALAGPATSFPQAIGLAAMFDPKFIFTVASLTGIEVRGKHNDYRKSGQFGFHKGASCFSPVINIMRHPLWGRNQETYGEDPYLSGVCAQQFVAGLQGNDSRYIQTSAGCKHFDVHGGPDNIPLSRFSFNSKVCERDWFLTFLPQFKMCVDAGTYSLMCSYNSVNGVPSCANKVLLTDILRKQWGFKGYVVSDDSAIRNIITYHHYLNTTTQTAAACVNAGCNLELVRNQTPVYNSLPDAVSSGLLTVDTMRAMVKPLFYTRMRLGEFDPPDNNPFSKFTSQSVQSELHRNMTLALAQKTMVLLKNEANFLPLPRRRYNNVAIIGPMANNTEQLFGDYSADVDPKYTTTPYQGLVYFSKHSVYYAQGCNDNNCTVYNSSSVKVAAGSGDIVFVCLGTGQQVESEGNDRADMNLPGQQLQLLKDVVTSVRDGISVVLLLFTASPVDIVWADDHPSVKAILQCFFPAQATGEAIQKILLADGEFGVPAGRLPFTWYRSLNQVPPITDYTMNGRTYRYFTGEPLYPFGYGLSYAQYYYSHLDISAQVIDAGQSLTVQVFVQNAGSSINGDEVIQVYISWMNPSVAMPRWQLVGFERRSDILPMETPRASTFTIEPRQMAVWIQGQGFIVQPGKMMVYAGGQQPHQTRSVGSNILQKSFLIHGHKFLGKF